MKGDGGGEQRCVRGRGVCVTSSSALGIPGLGQTLAAGTWPPVLLSPPARSPSCSQGRLRPSLSFGLAPVPALARAKGRPSQGACPMAHPNRQGLCPGRAAALVAAAPPGRGRTPLCPLRPGVSTPGGHNPRSSSPLKAISSSCSSATET